MEKIIKGLKELEELFIRCMQCGTCQAHCPLYQMDFFEGSVARGKISLIESIYEGKIEDVENTIKMLDRCLLCGRCKKNCPSGVDTTNIFLKAKSILRKIKDLSLKEKLILKFLLKNPHTISKFAPILNKGFKIATQKIEDDLYTSRISLFGKRNIRELKDKFFTSIYGGRHKAHREIAKVIFYPGCAINMLYIHWGEKILKFLNTHGVTVIIPEINFCCGIPAATMGKLDLTKELLTKNYEFFSKNSLEYVVCACPTCEHTLSSLNELVGLYKPHVKFIDVIVFIKKVLDIDFNKIIHKKSSLHVPCHYNNEHVQILVDLVKEISLNFHSLENQNCCGFGGTFNLKNYDTSISLSLEKAEEVQKKQIDILFTPCPGCAMNLTDAIAKKSIDCKVIHPIEAIES